MAGTKRPNILMIVADDLGYGDLGAFNEGIVATPVLDGLAHDGVCLRQHYSASPICAPARAALLTGRYPHRTGAITQHEMHGLDRIALRERTMADILKAGGYATGLVGKWHNGTLDRRFEPNARGYDEFTGFCGGWIDYYRWQLRVNDSLRPADGRYMTDVLTAAATDFIDRHASENFFLQLAYSAPHSPFQAPQPLVDKYLARGFNRIVATTYAMIEIMDQGIGRVLEALRRHGLEQDTIVLFTSDNGPAFFNPPYMLEPGEPTFNERFNAGLRGSKGWIYDGGIRVPMIVRWPAGLEGGRMCDELAHFTDWLPTLLAATGVPLGTGPSLDGHDLLPTLRGETGRVAPRQFWQWNFYVPMVTTNAAMRDGNWKLVRPMIAGTRFFSKDMYLTQEDEARTQAFVAADLRHKQDPLAFTEPLPVPRVRFPPPEPCELYDLAADPGETNDLAAAHPERVHTMLRALETWFEDVEQERLTIPGALTAARSG